MRAGINIPLILLKILLIFSYTQASAYELKGQVDRVSDGDTLLMITNGVPYKIRLLHIDSPERGRPYYKKSKQMLDSLITGKEITAQCTWLDSFNRHLCDIFVGNTNINRVMIERGGAWLHIKYYDFKKDPAHLIEAQKKAQQQRVGLWGISEYQKTLPWQWKKTN